MSAASCHLQLLDRVVRRASRLCGGSVSCDLGLRRRVAALSVFYRIRSLTVHSVKELVPPFYVAGRSTRRSDALHPWALVTPRFRTAQFSRSFIPACVRLWNLLSASDFAGDDLGAFKTAVNRTLLGRLQ